MKTPQSIPDLGFTLVGKSQYQLTEKILDRLDAQIDIKGLREILFSVRTLCDKDYLTNSQMAEIAIRALDRAALLAIKALDHAQQFNIKTDHDQPE